MDFLFRHFNKFFIAMLIVCALGFANVAGIFFYFGPYAYCKGQWCDGCGWYFVPGDVSIVRNNSGRDLRLCPRHYSEHVKMRNATAGAK